MVRLRRCPDVAYGVRRAPEPPAVIQAPPPVITDIREDAVLEVAPPDQTITMSSRPASDGATSR